jgi:hypothetical protein
MGYTSKVSGNIEIKPVVPHKDVLKLIEAGLAKRPDEKYYSGISDVFVDYYKNREDTDDGVLIKYEAWNIEPASEDRYKAYSIVEDLQKIVDLLGTEKYRYLGFFEIRGEDDDDLWRLKVKDGKVMEIKPKIVWPEDD